MRENRTCGSEGGEAQSLPYPYRSTQRSIQIDAPVKVSCSTACIRLLAWCWLWFILLSSWSHRVSSFSTLATMAFCSASGGRGIGLDNSCSLVILFMEMDLPVFSFE